MMTDSRASATATAMATAVDRTGAVLLVRLGERRYGLPLASVERVLPMAYILALPDSGDGLLGMLNLHGQVLPVVDPHTRLGLAAPKLSAAHKLVLMRAVMPFLLWVEDVEEVVDNNPEALSSVPGQQVSAVVSTILRLGDAIVPVLNPTALVPRGSSR